MESLSFSFFGAKSEKRRTEEIAKKLTDGDGDGIVALEMRSQSHFCEKSASEFNGSGTTS